MDKFIELSENEVMQLRDELLAMGTSLYKMRIYTDGETVKFKVNERIWSPPLGKMVRAN